MPTDKETTAAYSLYAEKWAHRKKTGSNPAHEYLSPQMYANLPDLSDKDVLSVGCGAGEECDHIKQIGAKSVVGTDISPGLIELARDTFPGLRFEVMDMEHLAFPDNSFDLVFSNLAFHYVENWKDIMSGINRVLRPGGELLFSTHHPVKWGAEFKKDEDERSHLLGYKKLPKSDEFEIYGDYLNTRLIDDIWFDDFHVKYYHRSLEAIMRDILTSGMELTDFQEPKPIESAKDEDYSFWAIHQKIPTFLIFKLIKRTIIVN